MGSRLKISREQLSIPTGRRRHGVYVVSSRVRLCTASRDVEREPPASPDRGAVSPARALMPGIANGRKHPSRECSEDYLARRGGVRETPSATGDEQRSRTAPEAAPCRSARSVRAAELRWGLCLPGNAAEPATWALGRSLARPPREEKPDVWRWRTVWRIRRRRYRCASTARPIPAGVGAALWGLVHRDCLGS